MRRTARLVFGVAAVVALTTCGGRGDGHAWFDTEPRYAEVTLEPVAAPVVPESEEDSFLVAEATRSRIRAFRSPGGKVLVSFANPGPFGESRVFLVRKDRGDWLRALLPMRPNEAEGWIRAGDVRLSRHSYRIEIDLSDRRLTVFDGDRVFGREPVAVGTESTPTPTGDFYTTLLVKPDEPGGPYGAYAYGLSAYSEVYEEFAGGDGQVAIHGTNAPYLIGQAVSHGCIRMHNDAISRLAKKLPLGTPVRITA